MQTNPVSCHLLGDKTKGGYMSQERSTCEVEKWPQPKGNRSGEEKPTIHGSTGVLSPCQGCLPLGRASAHYAPVIIIVKITSVAFPPPQTVLFGPLLSKILQTLHLIHITPFSLCTYVWARQSPEDTLWSRFSGTVCLILFESVSHWRRLELSE